MSEPAGPRRPICCPPYSSASLILIYSLATTPGSVLTVPSLLALFRSPGGQRFSARGAAVPALCARGGCAGPPPLLYPHGPLSSVCPARSCCSVPGLCSWGTAGAQGTRGCPGVGGDFWVPSLSVGATCRAPGTVPIAPHCTRGLGAAGPVPLGLLGCSPKKGRGAGPPRTDRGSRTTAEHPCRAGAALGAGADGILCGWRGWHLAG